MHSVLSKIVCFLYSRIAISNWNTFIYLFLWVLLYFAPLEPILIRSCLALEMTEDMPVPLCKEGGKSLQQFLQVEKFNMCSLLL